MLFFSLIFSLKSLEFILTDQNIEELAEKSISTPVFNLYYSPYCRHCQKIHPIWKSLMNKYSEENGIIISEVDCIASKKACKYFMNVNSYPTFAIIKKNETVKISVNRDLEAWSKFVDRLLLFGTNYRCKIWLGQVDTFPTFILTTTKGAEETCDEILEIIEQVPKSKGHIYSNPNGTEYSCQVNMNEENSYIFGNQTNYTVFIPFIKEFILQPFGDWEISDAIESERCIAFFIYDDKRSLKKFSEIAFNQSDEFVFGKIEYEKFSNMYPDVELEKSELPALGISNYRHSHFMLMTNVKVNDQLISIFKAIATGKEDNNMTYSMAKLLNANNSILKVNFENESIIFLFVIIIIIFLIVCLWKRLSSKSHVMANGRRRRNTTLAKAYNELKLLFLEKCSFKKQKVPASLL